MEKSMYVHDISAIDEYIGITEKAVEFIRVHVPQTIAKFISDCHREDKMKVEADFILLEGSVDNFEMHHEESFLHNCNNLLSRRKTLNKV